MRILKGHVSAETAYVKENYPYGFGLRCLKRYWIEYRPHFGFRLLTQTTKPWRETETMLPRLVVWNRAHASRYARLGRALWLDEHGYVHCAELDGLSSTEQGVKWMQTYGMGVPGKERVTL